MSDKKTVYIGSRKSQLALVQTHHVIDRLKELHGSKYNFELKTLDTVGDRVLNVALSKIGDKGLFTKELEDLMISGDIDIAVHSLKDIPTKFPEGLGLGAITKRENCLDAFIVNASKHRPTCTLAELPEGAIIGSSSLRRVSQLKRAYPHLQFKDIRGNLNTRFEKLEKSGEYDGMILAVAGLERLGWTDRITEIIQPTVSLYAVGQGALGIECRSNDPLIMSLLEPLNDKDTASCCIAERAMLSELEGGCHVPIGVISSIDVERQLITLEGIVLNLDGSRAIRLSHTGPLASCHQVGRELAQQLIEKGAKEILNDLSK
ncbi:porphobilinogen deaminase [Cavenderia fasciculata]|uniref:Porphobilinogen deaminase n=1 Tax=Cavenderia fasciculata TaxID=261658 RepID=F4PW25_CACFS|nr:porphobilinogen deaminase [Cavenderia fasciculata]EGG20189.1 porphobilinogen deaminase [Cavenderia fasciculata]|eukprot:XP_004367172.1 porphobilinogen deaminase [Cavenderia fasciculata]